MYLVIGNEGCSRCKMVTGYLLLKGVKYEYKLLNSLEEDIQKEYVNLAREKGLMQMPIIIKDEEVIPVEQIFLL